MKPILCFLWKQCIKKRSLCLTKIQHMKEFPIVSLLSQITFEMDLVRDYLRISLIYLLKPRFSPLYPMHAWFSTLRINCHWHRQSTYFAHPVMLRYRPHYPTPTTGKKSPDLSWKIKFYKDIENFCVWGSFSATINWPLSWKFHGKRSGGPLCTSLGIDRRERNRLARAGKRPPCRMEIEWSEC